MTEEQAQAFDKCEDVIWEIKKKERRKGLHEKKKIGKNIASWDDRFPSRGFVAGNRAVIPCDALNTLRDGVRVSR